eukprot:7668026-Alexandrium_andersonii.AAC.1
MSPELTTQYLETHMSRTRLCAKKAKSESDAEAPNPEKRRAVRQGSGTGRGLGLRGTRLAKRRSRRNEN